MRALTLAMMAVVAVGCAQKSSEPAQAAPAMAKKASTAPEVKVKGERVHDEHVQRIGKRELDCLDEPITVIDQGDYLRATGCNRLIFWIKNSPKEWVRAGPAFELDAKDRPLIAEPEQKDPKFAAPVQTAHANLELTDQQWASLTQWQPVVQADCVARPNGTIGYCYATSTEPAILAAMEKAIPRFKYEPAELDGKAVASPVVVAMRVEAPNGDCAHLTLPNIKELCEQQGKGAAMPKPASAGAP